MRLELFVLSNSSDTRTLDTILSDVSSNLYLIFVYFYLHDSCIISSDVSVTNNKTNYIIHVH